MYNRELQSNGTQEKAYLLGLFYADGMVVYQEKVLRIKKIFICLILIKI